MNSIPLLWLETLSLFIFLAGFVLSLTHTEIRTARYNPPWTPPFMLRNEIWAILEE